MEKNRYLNDVELAKIRVEEDLLKGNINRMCVCDDYLELLHNFYFASSRLHTIFKINSKKFS